MVIDLLRADGSKGSTYGGEAAGAFYEISVEFAGERKMFELSAEGGRFAGPSRYIAGLGVTWARPCVVRMWVYPHGSSVAPFVLWQWRIWCPVTTGDSAPPGVNPSFILGLHAAFSSVAKTRSVRPAGALAPTRSQLEFNFTNEERT